MAQQYLSFNEQFGGRGSFGVPEEEDPAVVEALKEQPLRLRDTWALWEQVVNEGRADVKFADALKRVVKFNTAQEFWGIFNAIPQPSELLDQRRITREQDNHAPVPIDAIMIFKDGIKPEWEDPLNASGGHFQISLKSSVGGGQIDEYWNNVVLAMIGGTLEPADIVTGLRLVDKLSGPKMAAAIRIELWFAKFNDTNSVNTLKRSFDKALATRVDGSHNHGAPKSDTKPHSTLSKH